MLGRMANLATSKASRQVASSLKQLCARGCCPQCGAPLIPNRVAPSPVAGAFGPGFASRYCHCPHHGSLAPLEGFSGPQRSSQRRMLRKASGDG